MLSFCSGGDLGGGLLVSVAHGVKLNKGRSIYFCISLKENLPPKKISSESLKTIAARKISAWSMEVRMFRPLSSWTAYDAVRLDSTPGSGGAEYMMKVTEE